MPSINPDPIVRIKVEYDRHRTRVSKAFNCLWEARRFYAMKHKAGKNPKVRKKE